MVTTGDGDIAHVEPGDAGYPALLAAVERPPALWVRGAVQGQDALAVAIVGARRATAYGLQVAETFAGDLAARGVTIVSGLARGVDTAAHRAALEAGGRTLAVLGSGVDRVYPPENRALARAIARQGAVVSQFPPGIPPLAHHFPARNRTLAALALAVVVVEAGERSGALITARLAGELGREVCAVPGQIGSPASRGAHGLIRDGATLVERWEDVVRELPEPWQRAVRVLETPAATTAAPGGDEGRMRDLLTIDEPQHIERLIARAGVDAARAGAALIALELGGWARQLGGQRWVAARPRTG
jgi:DNA processing protein